MGLIPLRHIDLIFKGLLPLALTTILLSAVGCGQEPSEVGVVARVNGQPIYLSQLEAKYDLSHLGWSGSVSPTLGKLKEDYSRILSELIAQELIFQVLDEKGFAVTEEEMLHAEAKVRADYPKGMFEQVLVEEYIDLDVWRRQLRAHLAYEKFLQHILRPRIVIEPAEIEAYYQHHLDVFNLPARVVFALVSGPDKDTVRQAVELYQAEGDLQNLSQAFEGVRAQEIKILQDRLTKKWSEALAGIPEGGATRPLSAQEGYEVLVLLERRPAQQLAPAEAYPLVEKILLEKKLQEAFSQWLENELADADIFVSQQLLAKEMDESEAADPVPSPESEKGVPLGDEDPGELDGVQDSKQPTTGWNFSRSREMARTFASPGNLLRGGAPRPLFA